jgi:hypothetical protein
VIGNYEHCFNDFAKAFIHLSLIIPISASLPARSQDIIYQKSWIHGLVKPKSEKAAIDQNKKVKIDSSHV